MRSHRLPMQRWTPDEYRALLEVARRHDYQDYLIIYCAYSGFLRVSEVLDIREEDVLPDGRLFCKRGKGSQSNILPITDAQVAQALSDLARSERPNCTDGRLFNRSARTLNWRLHRYCAEAGIGDEKAHMHAAKHTACQDTLDSTGSIMATRSLAGHSDIGSTLRYCEMSTDTALRLRQHSASANEQREAAMWEEYRDREEDERVFGTPQRKPN